MKKAIGTMILLGASAASLITPATAATPDLRDAGRDVGGAYHQTYDRGQRGRGIPVQTERNRHERFDRRAWFNRDCR